MELKVLKDEFSVTKISTLQNVDIRENFFIAHTDEEISLVCPSKYVPEQFLNKEDGWKGFRIEGILDFSLIGILAGITSVLAKHKIGVFVVSTYNTDYIFVKKEKLPSAIKALCQAGYQITEDYDD